MAKVSKEITSASQYNHSGMFMSEAFTFTSFEVNVNTASSSYTKSNHIHYLGSKEVTSHAVNPSERTLSARTFTTYKKALWRINKRNVEGTSRSVGDDKPRTINRERSP